MIPLVEKLVEGNEDDPSTFSISEPKAAVPAAERSSPLVTQPLPKSHGEEAEQVAAVAVAVDVVGSGLEYDLAQQEPERVVELRVGQGSRRRAADHRNAQRFDVPDRLREPPATDLGDRPAPRQRAGESRA
jgi:hypothetical protein